MDLSQYFTDPNGDQLEYFIADLPFGSGLELYQTGELKGVPTFADATSPQPLQLRVMVSDGKSSVVETVSVKVLTDPSNKPPLSSRVEDQWARQGAEFELDLSAHFSDEDESTTLDYFVAGLPFGSGLKLFSNGILSGVATFADLLAQPLHIKVLASDGKASTMESFLLHVEPNTTNGCTLALDAPRVRLCLVCALVLLVEVVVWHDSKAV